MFSRLYTHHFFRNHNYYDRERYENILKDPKSVVWRRINRFIDMCVFASVGIIILETVGDFSEKYQLPFFILDALISLVFAAEYNYRFMRAKNKKFFVTRPMNIIDFLSFAPFFIGMMFLPIAWFDFLKVLRLARILRLFEVSSHSPIALWFMRTLRAYKQEYVAIWAIFLSILIIISTFVYYLENAFNPDFSSIPQSMWWGIVTMSTVWYGDMVPTTVWWKILWSIVILLWPVMLAVMSSITILVFMDVAESHKQTIFKSCSKCRTRNDDEANYCKNCGNKHFISEVSWPAAESKIPFIGKLFSQK